MLNVYLNLNACKQTIFQSCIMFQQSTSFNINFCLVALEYFLFPCELHRASEKLKVIKQKSGNKYMARFTLNHHFARALPPGAQVHFLQISVLLHNLVNFRAWCKVTFKNDKAAAPFYFPVRIWVRAFPWEESNDWQAFDFVLVCARLVNWVEKFNEKRFWKHDNIEFPWLDDFCFKKPCLIFQLFSHLW